MLLGDFKTITVFLENAPRQKEPPVEKSSLSERERLVVGALPRDQPPRLDGSRQLPPVEPVALPPGLGNGKGKLEEPKSAPLRVGRDP